MAAERSPITYEDREQIEAGLNRGDRLATIARSLGRTQQTVADEIRRNWTSEITIHFSSRYLPSTTTATSCMPRVTRC